MDVTLAALVETVRQELGRSPGRSSPEALVNEAGEAWVNGHSWRYLRERTQSINLVEGVEDYPLVAGTLSVGTHLYRPNSTWPPITIWEYGAFVQERERYLSGIDRTFTPIAAVHWEKKAGDVGTRLYLQVWPATLTETVVVQSQSGWVPLDVADSVADIPQPLAYGFLEWLRRYALGREAQPSVNVDAAWVSFFSGPVGIATKTVDSQHGGIIIPALSSAGTRYQRGKAARMGAVGDASFYDRLRLGGSRP